LGRPGDHAGALTDPQQADGEREETHNQERSGHGFPLLPLWNGFKDAPGDGYRQTIAKDDP
jgi:hypothetical protein